MTQYTIAAMSKGKETVTEEKDMVCGNCRFGRSVDQLIFSFKGTIKTLVQYRDMHGVLHQETLFEIEDDGPQSGMPLIDIPAGVHRCCPQLPFWHKRDVGDSATCVNKTHFDGNRK